MTYSDYSLTHTEYKTYKKVKTSQKLQDIWSDLLRRISDDNLKKEAEEKGYVLIDNPDLDNDTIANYFMIQIPNASKELQTYLADKLYPYVVCLKS